MSNGGFVKKNNEVTQLDHDLLDGYMHSVGIEVVKKMFTLYAQQAAIYLVDIEKSLLSGSTQLWQEHCHKMKGAAGSVGFKALHARLTLMEKTTASNVEKAQQLAELKTHNQQAMVDFNYWLERI